MSAEREIARLKKAVAELSAQVSELRDQLFEILYDANSK